MTHESSHVLLFLIFMVTLTTCYGALNLFGWSSPKDQKKNPTPEEAFSSKPCNWMTPSYDSDSDDAEYHDAHDREGDEQPQPRKMFYRVQKSPEPTGIYVAKPRVDRGRTEEDDEDNDDDVDDNRYSARRGPDEDRYRRQHSGGDNDRYTRHHGMDENRHSRHQGADDSRYLRQPIEGEDRHTRHQEADENRYLRQPSEEEDSFARQPTEDEDTHTRHHDEGESRYLRPPSEEDRFTMEPADDEDMGHPLEDGDTYERHHSEDEDMHEGHQVEDEDAEHQDVNENKYFRQPSEDEDRQNRHGVHQKDFKVIDLSKRKHKGGRRLGGPRFRSIRKKIMSVKHDIDVDDDDKATTVEEEEPEVVQKPIKRKECRFKSHGRLKKAASVDEDEATTPHDPLRQAAEPANPEEKKEVNTSSHLYKTSLLVAFIWLFNVGFVIWSMTRKNYVIKMKVPNNVDSRHPLKPDIYKHALKDKTSQTAVSSRPSRVYQKHPHSLETDLAPHHLNQSQPPFQPPPPPRPYEQTNPVVKETPQSLESYNSVESVTDIPVRLYFKDVKEHDKFTQAGNMGYLNTPSRLVKEYARSSRQELSGAASPRTYEETRQATSEGALNLGIDRADTRNLDGAQSVGLHQAYSSGIISRIEKVKHTEYNMNYSGTKYNTHEDNRVWTSLNTPRYSATGRSLSANINNQHFLTENNFRRDFTSIPENSNLDREPPKYSSPLVRERMKVRSHSNASTQVSPVLENNKMSKNSRIKKSFSATTQCPSIHSVKCEINFNALKNDKETSAVVGDVPKNVQPSPSLKQENISVQTEENTALLNKGSVIHPAQIVDVLARYFDRMEETSNVPKPSSELIPESERKDAKENLYKIFNVYGNQLQDYNSVEVNRSKQKSVMPPPPLGYHIRSCCSSSDSTIRELDSKVDMSDGAPTSSGQTSEGLTNNKKRKRSKQDDSSNGHKLRPVKEINDSDVKVVQNSNAIQELCAGDHENNKKYMIVRKVSFSKPIMKQHVDMPEQISSRDSDNDVKRDKQKREKEHYTNERHDSNGAKRRRPKPTSVPPTGDAKQHASKIQFAQDKNTRPVISGSKKYVLYLYDPSQKTDQRKRRKNTTNTMPMKYVERNCNNESDDFIPPPRLKETSLQNHGDLKVKRPCFNYRPVLKRKNSHKNNASFYGDVNPFIYKVTSSCAMNVNANNVILSDKEDSGEVIDHVENMETASPNLLVPAQSPQSEENGDVNAEDVAAESGIEIIEDISDKAVVGIDSKRESPVNKAFIMEDAWENRKSIIMQACHEAIKNRLQKQNSEEVMTSDKSADLERKPSLPSRFLPEQTPQVLDEKVQSRSSTSSHEDQSPTEALKRKRKTKTTEALYIKFESSLSKKVTTTMTNGRKTVSSKFISERKTAPQTVESVKSEDGEKRTSAETPRLTRIIRGNEAEPTDKKRKKQNSETCLEHLTNKEHLRNSWARHQTEDNILNPKDSEHRFDAVKDLLNAACKGEDFGATERALSHGSLVNSKSSSPNLPSNRNLFGDVKIKSANSDLSSDKGAHGKSRITESDKLDALSASNVKDGTRKSESLSSHKIKERGSKRIRHKGSISPGGQKKSLKKKRASSSKSKKSSEEGGKEKSREQTKKAHFLTVSKKSPVRTCSPRGGESKQKKKSSKVKDIHTDDNSVSEPKPEKAKAKKSGEKLTEKKRKKAKKREEVDVDISEKDDDSTSVKQISVSAPVRMSARDRSRSPSPRSCSPSMCRTASPTGTSSKSRIKEGRQVKHDSKYDVLSDSDRSQTTEKSRSLDRELVNSERGKRRKKSCSAASADNIICSTPSTKRLRSTESVPLFVENVLSNQSIKSDKAEKSNSLSSASSKLKRSEKDLQKAELGWNSSLVSESIKQAEEKSKILQRRKLKYLIVKARNEKALAPRLRNTTQRSNPADGESVGSHSENELKSDSTPRDKAAAISQPKSVQFSESIEDMEAQKIASAAEGYLANNGKDGDTTEQTPVAENTEVEAEEEAGSVDKPAREVTEAVKEKPQEAPQRSQSTPPVRRRPVWLKPKKTDEQKTNQPQRQHHMSTPLKLKLRNSSDAHLKGARVSGHLYYPTKAGTSPRTSNVSLSGKLVACRNGLLNAPPQATAPPTKSTKKVIATVGSPVDIKEILEGSSVDALDHSKALVVRPTKSVPAFGHTRGSSDSAPGKRGKHSNDLRVYSAKKKIRRLLDSSSIRSISSNDTGDEHFRSSKGHENQTSPTASVMTDLDEAHPSSNRYGASSSTARIHPRRKEKKVKKRAVHINNSVNWQLVAAQDQDSIPRVPYDYSDYDFLQCGLSLMVQRFFNRITNFSSDQRPNNPNASGDMASQRIAE